MGGEVVIAKYDPSWALLFDALGTKLRQSLGSSALRIDHVGSTAVPNLAAKPIIDIQISVASLEPMSRYQSDIEKIGFRFRRDETEMTRRYFREQEGLRRTHIHVRQFGSLSEQMTLLFRDYLRVSEEEASYYARIKEDLSAAHKIDRLAYSNAKSPVIWDILGRAVAWSSKTGWFPDRSDK